MIYYSNPEYKKSSIGIVIFFIIVFMVGLLAIRLQQNSLKEQYVRTVGTIGYKLIDKNPQLKDEILPIITQGINESEYEKSEKFLEEQGLNKDLDSQFYPSLQNNMNREIQALSVILIVSFICFYAMNYYHHKKLYNKINKVSELVEKVIEGDYKLSLDNYEEGDIAKLSSRVNEMKNIIGVTIDNLNKEKAFLVDLLSDISHQLKTPLASIMMINDIMLEKEIGEEQKQVFLMNNKSQLIKMEILIKYLLKQAKLDAKAINFDFKLQDLKETVDEAILAIINKANEKNLKINFARSESVFLNQDKIWLEEAIINIIKNAVDHTPRGGKIDIDISENPVCKKILIKDSGEGISEKDITNVFKRFYTSKGGSSEHIGIGLALSKSIVEAHGGLISVNSKKGEGTSFEISFIKI